MAGIETAAGLSVSRSRVLGVLVCLRKAARVELQKMKVKRGMPRWRKNKPSSALARFALVVQLRLGKTRRDGREERSLHLPEVLEVKSVSPL